MAYYFSYFTQVKRKGGQSYLAMKQASIKKAYNKCFVKFSFSSNSRFEENFMLIRTLIKKTFCSYNIL